MYRASRFQPHEQDQRAAPRHPLSSGSVQSARPQRQNAAGARTDHGVRDRAGHAAQADRARARRLTCALGRRALHKLQRALRPVPHLCAAGHLHPVSSGLPCVLCESRNCAAVLCSCVRGRHMRALVARGHEGCVPYGVQAALRDTLARCAPSRRWSMQQAWVAQLLGHAYPPNKCLRNHAQTRQGTSVGYCHMHGGALDGHIAPRCVLRALLLPGSGARHSSQRKRGARTLHGRDGRLRGVTGVVLPGDLRGRRRALDHVQLLRHQPLGMCTSMGLETGALLQVCACDVTCTQSLLRMAVSLGRRSRVWRATCCALARAGPRAVPLGRPRAFVWRTADLVPECQKTMSRHASCARASTPPPPATTVAAQPPPRGSGQGAPAGASSRAPRGVLHTSVARKSCQGDAPAAARRAAAPRLSASAQHGRRRGEGRR